jgi:hypothetical protein
MVIISAAIVSKARTLLARQYLEVSRLQVEGLLSAFTKLVDSGRGGDSSGVKADHTFVETESVRFVYQPMESGLYLVLMTTKNSNIIENLETLRLLTRLTQEICHANPASSSTQASITNEETIIQNAFDLVFAFDEAISFGYREPVTSAQINQYVEMESHEERLHQMIQQSKENEAKETARRKQLELAELRKKQQKEDKLTASMSPVSTTGGGVGSSSAGGAGYETSMDGSGTVEKFDRQRRQEDLLARQAALVAAASARGPAEPMATWNPTMNTEAVDYTGTTTSAAAPKRGMALGGAGRRRIDQ